VSDVALSVFSTTWLLMTAPWMEFGSLMTSSTDDSVVAERYTP
jgi:hypothetical protein